MSESEYPWYWAQPDIDDRRGYWTVCMNPKRPEIIADFLDRETAEKTAEIMMKQRSASVSNGIKLRWAR